MEAYKGINRHRTSKEHLACLSQWKERAGDPTRDLTGKENVSIVICFVDKENVEIREQLLVMATTGSGDAQSITSVILCEL